jgi:putative transposase
MIIGGTLRQAGGISLELNGAEDHVHLVAKLRPTRALSDVLRDLRANATGWMHDVFPSRKTSAGSVVMARSLSANQMSNKFGDTLRGRKNIIGRFRFGMSSFNS